MPGPEIPAASRGWSYLNRGKQPPDNEIRVELPSPSAERWEFGPAGAADSVTGAAEDFCIEQMAFIFGKMRCGHRNTIPNGILAHRRFAVIKGAH